MLRFLTLVSLSTQNEMTMGLWMYMGIGCVCLLIFGIASRSSAKKELVAKQVLEDVSALGDDLVPTSIHPAVDPDRCIGSGACVQACPEKNVIGLIDGRVELVNPLACVGHGACASACPVGAIELVFGTARRGVELPQLDETFQTSQPGVYVVGELGGMGLIRNAIRQGMEVGEYIAKTDRKGVNQGEIGNSDTVDIFDAIVVGAGPAGIGAGLQLVKEGLKVVVLEAETFGGAIAHYPRAKIAMTGALDIPLFRRVRKRTMSKEQLMELWNEVRQATDLPVQVGQEVVSLVDHSTYWDVVTKTGNFKAANVVLALGRRGAPRKLGVPGEELSKVVYRLLEPEVFVGKHMLVVGGGNSAAECAIALADYGQCAGIGISYRRGEFARLRRQVRLRLQSLIDAVKITPFLKTEVAFIHPDAVVLSEASGEQISVPNDHVIVQIGGTSPSALLSSFGIQTVEKRGEA